MKPLCSRFAQRVTTTIVGVLLLGSLFFYADPFYFSLLIGAVGVWVITTELPRLVAPNKLFFWLLALVYITAPIALAIDLNQHPQARYLLLLCLAVCFGHDAAAYVFGTLFGKHKLAPTLSPNKSWQGVLGGFLYVTGLLYYVTAKPAPMVTLLGIALVLSALCTVGDLFESYLKRKAGVKDSGCLLPGQGGLLDRIDSILFVVPFIWTFQAFLLLLIQKI